MAVFQISANADIRIQAPWDERIAKRTKAQLIDPDTWSKDGDTLYVYRNMLVATDEGLFQLLDVDKVLEPDYSGWKWIDVPSLTSEEIVEMISDTLAGYVEKEEGKGLSSNDYSDADKAQVASTAAALTALQQSFDTLVSGNASEAIESFNEIISFLATIADDTTLDAIIAAINQSIAAVEAKIPTKVSQLENDANYATVEEVDDVRDTADAAAIDATAAKTAANTAVTTAAAAELAAINANTTATAANQKSDTAMEAIKSLSGLADTNEVMVQLAQQIAKIEQNVTDIQALKDGTVYLTKAEYQTLKDNGQILANVEYNIYE